MLFIFILSLVRSLVRLCIPKKIGTLDRSTHPAWGEMRFAICMYDSPPHSLSLSLSPSASLRLLLHPLDLCDWNRSIFWSENTSTWRRKHERMHTCLFFFSLSLCVCNDDHLSRDRRRRLSLSLVSLVLALSLFFCARFCYSPSSNTILLANSHQFIHRSRERKREPRERTKRLIEVVLCDGLCAVRSFSIFSFPFFVCLVKKKFLSVFPSPRLIFFSFSLPSSIEYSHLSQEIQQTGRIIL